MRRFALRRALASLAFLLPLATVAAPPALQNAPEAARLYGLASREAQYHRLISIPDAVVEYGRFGRVRQIDGHTHLFLPNAGKLKQGDSVAPLFQEFKPILLASGAESLVVRNVVPAPKGGHYVLTEQWIDGLPVIDARVNFIVNTDGEVHMMNSLFVPRSKATRTPKISLQLARTKLEQALIDTEMADAGTVKLAPESSLAFWTNEGTEEMPRLLWMIDANFTLDGESRMIKFGIDATTGEVRHLEQRRFELNRTVYSNGYRSTLGSLPSTLTFLWGEGGYPSPAEPQASYVYDKIRDSIQAWAGTPFAYDTLGLAVHYGLPGSGEAQSSWFNYGSDNKPYLIFGDQRATDNDAIAHEYGHGLFVGRVPGRPSSNIKYWDEWFAGTEFYADYSSVVTDIWRRNGGVNPIDTWAITDLRNWMDPQTKGGTFLSRDWYGDWRYAGLGDVPYSNSTIFGHAVFLMITGGYHARRGQIAWGNVIPSILVPPAPAEQIKQVLSYGLWRLAVYNHGFSGPNFRDHTVAAAYELYGPATVADSVSKAWQAVGIGHACTAPPSVPLPSIESFLCRGGHRITWPTMPGTKYHGEIVRSGYPWDLAKTSLDVGSPDIGTGTCPTNVGVTSRFHMRACNGCGCSDWSPAETLQFYPICL